MNRKKRRNRCYCCWLLLIVYLLSIVIFNIKMNKNKDTIEQLNKELAERDLRIEELYNTEPQVIVESTEVIVDYLDTATKAMNYIAPLRQYDKLEYFNQYKSILNDYEDILDRPETVYDYFTEEQIRMMWKCIETETYDCPFDAKVGVACVILNRVEHDMFPTDPIDVIKSPNQFAYGRNNITDTTKLALEYAFEIEDVTNGCVGFRSDVNPQKWNGWTYKYTDGYHYFYSMEGDD